jgi:hypothetical protein
MTDFTEVPEPAVAPAPDIKISRTRAKRLFNMHLAEIRERTDTTKHQAQVLADEVQRQRGHIAELESKLRSANALMEGTVRRHGSQTFERSQLTAECMTGLLRFDITPDRITVRLADSPCTLVSKQSG